MDYEYISIFIGQDIEYSTNRVFFAKYCTPNICINFESTYLHNLYEIHTDTELYSLVVSLKHAVNDY